MTAFGHPNTPLNILTWCLHSKTVVVKSSASTHIRICGQNIQKVFDETQTVFDSSFLNKQQQPNITGSNVSSFHQTINTHTSMLETGLVGCFEFPHRFEFYRDWNSAQTCYYQKAWLRSCSFHFLSNQQYTSRPLKENRAALCGQPWVYLHFQPSALVTTVRIWFVLDVHKPPCFAKTCPSKIITVEITFFR